MHPTEPSRAEALAAMTPEKLEEMARPAPRASHPGLRDFLEIPYDQLEEMNLEAKEERLAGERCAQAKAIWSFRGPESGTSPRQTPALVAFEVLPPQSSRHLFWSKSYGTRLEY